jgi:hypothetical protein
MDSSELFGEARRGLGLAELVQACPGATVDDEIRLLRQGHSAIMKASASNPGLFEGIPGAARFEGMLVCGAPESAALSLVPRQAGFMLSRGPNGRHIGSVFMTECGEHRLEGNTAALAIMAATLSAFHALLGQIGPRTEMLH